MLPALRRGEVPAYPQRYAPSLHIARDELKVLWNLSLAFMCPRTPLANEASGFDWLWFGADNGNLADGSTWICMSRV
ncbi:hypothetical protein GNZ12_03300 [Paraburkholderia sp. 1N]|uniref:Uncharacterized protein n=1 Tax=Paraburkholderia solitsugae TaxID=2675748 RepID=A0ABX2BHF7_9BURK|nr:hypothetical protein [Paraburkholderia solitsugae]NPT40355.1 hypothetical protein [Paraburkholderia solitsugae]